MSSTAFSSPAPTPAPALTPVQEQVISLMAEGMTVSGIADQMDIHRNTIGNWRRGNPAFARALAEAQYDRAQYWRNLAEEHASLAIAIIGEILHSQEAPAGVRLRAALAILKHATTLPPAEQVATPVEESELTDTQESGPDPADFANVMPIDGKSKKVHNPAQSAPPPPKTATNPKPAQTSASSGGPLK